MLLLREATERMFWITARMLQLLYVCTTFRPPFSCPQVIKTCKKMGIRTVAVHSDVDSSAVSDLIQSGLS